MAKDDLTQKQKIFCSEYIIDWNQTRAYMAAYPDCKTENSACVSANKLLIKKHINGYIGIILPEHKKRLKKQNGVIKELQIINKIGYIYLIKCIGTHYYKIGKSINGGESRLISMQTGIPFELELIENIKCNNYSNNEKRLHKLYKKNHIRGEWFTFSDAMLFEVVNKIKALAT